MPDISSNAILTLDDRERALDRASEPTAETWTGVEMTDLWAQLEEVRTTMSPHLRRAAFHNEIAE